MLDAKEKKVVSLCDPRTQHSCPKVEFNKDEILITDDFGGKVILDRDQWAILKEKISEGQL